LELIYLVRGNCIVLAYFPEGSQYSKYFENTEHHPGWDDVMNEDERDILYSFKKIEDSLKKDPCDTSSFLAVDKKFGKYRHLKWLEKVNSN